MLLVVSFGLVLVATVLLVLGLITDGGLVLIYGSISLSLAAALLLFVSARSSRLAGANARKPGRLTPVASDEADEVDESNEATASVEKPQTPKVATGTKTAMATKATKAARSAESPAPVPADFPIADYDDLHEYEVLPLIAELPTADLAAVEARERAGAARPEVLEALASRRRERVGGLPPWIKGSRAAGDETGRASRTEPASASAAASAAPASAPAPVSPWAPEPADESDDELLVAPAARTLTPVPAITPDDASAGANGAPTAGSSKAATTATGARSGRVRVRVHRPLPIPGYDEMNVSEIVGFLGGLDASQLEQIAEHEKANRGRRTVITSVDRHLKRLAAPPRTAAASRTRTGAMTKATNGAKAKSADNGQLWS